MFRGRTATFFRHVERVFYVAVAGVLGIAGILLFIDAIVGFLSEFGDDLGGSVLTLLDGILLVFIVTELIHTITSVIRENVLLTEPFLIVGIVAMIRRLIVISAEAKSLVGTPEFNDTMLEMGLLTLVVAVLALAIFMLRHTTRSEPRPAYEPEPEDIA